VDSKAYEREEERRHREEKYRYFVPNGKQDEFNKLAGGGKHFVIILSAGNGVGKTADAVNLLANIIFEPKTAHFRDLPLVKEWPYPKRARIVTESKNVEEIGAIDQEIKTWWPVGKYKGSKVGKQYISLYEAGEWIIDKMSYEQDVKEFESSTLGLVWFDEPPPKPIFDACKWRMRKGGIIIITMTPLEGAAWIFEEGGLLDSDDCAVVYADMEDNCKTHGKGGQLEHAHIELILKDATDAEKEARKSGKPLSTVNTIWGPLWVPDVHIIEDDVEAPPGSQFGMTVDPGDGKPYACAWWWVDPRGHIVFDYNWPEENWVKVLKAKQYQTLRMDDYLKIFAQYEKGRKMEWEIMDRHYGNTRDGRTGRSLIDDWNREPFNRNFIPSYNTEEELDTGIKMVKNYLKFDRTQPINAMNVPRIYVKKRCKNIIMSIPKWPNKVDPESYISKPDRSSVYKDFCDDVRYTCMLKPEAYVPRHYVQKGSGYVLGR
jgi:phage terminase large subunit-like protein